MNEENDKKLSERVKEKTARARQHVKNNRTIYLAATGGAIVGGTVVGIIALRRIGLQVPEIQQTAKNTALIVWKSPPTNIALVKNECMPPIPVLDKMTGIPYPSLNQAAKQTGEALRIISQDVHGLKERFERLPESVFA